MLDVPFAMTSAAARIRREAGRRKGDRTEGKRRRDERDLVILLCHKVGLSHRAIAGVFKLARSRVSEIIEEQQARHGA